MITFARSFCSLDVISLGLLTWTHLKYLGLLLFFLGFHFPLNHVYCRLFSFEDHFSQWRRKKKKIELNPFAFFHTSISTIYSICPPLKHCFCSNLNLVTYCGTCPDWCHPQSNINTPSSHRTEMDLTVHRFNIHWCNHSGENGKCPWSLESCKGKIKIFLIGLLWGLRFEMPLNAR